MYINPFFAGVCVTIFIEAVLINVIAIVNSIRNKERK